MRNFSLPLGVAVEEGVHDDGAARVGEELAAQADQAAAGHAEFDAHAAIAVVVHVGDFAFARAELLHDHADEFFGNVDGQVLDRLHQLAVFFIALGDDLGLADHKLVAFAAHHFDQNGKLKFAAAKNFEGIGRSGVFHAQGDVGEQFFFEALAQVARSDVGAISTGERRGIHREQHRDGGLVNGDGRQRRGILSVGDGFADGDAFHARDGDDVA